MKTNNEGLTLIKMGRTFNKKAVTNGDVTVIGFGTTHYPNGKKVSAHDSCYVELGEAWLKFELKKVEKIVADKVGKIELTENQFSALVSLVEDIGEASFAKTALLKHVKAGELSSVNDEQFLQLTGDETRRLNEATLFNS